MKTYLIQFEVPAKSQDEANDWAKRVWGPCGEICRQVHIDDPNYVPPPLYCIKERNNNDTTL